jgi:hypothetical protein
MKQSSSILSWIVLLALAPWSCHGSSIRGDAGVDVTPEPDVPEVAEIVPDPGVDPEPDRSTDPEEEPEPDSEGCVSRTDGECDVVTQCGCPEEHWCRRVLCGDCSFGEVCISSSYAHGTLDVGEPCTWQSLNTECRPGTLCTPGTSPTGNMCRQWCFEDSDCTGTGSTCRESYDLYSLAGPPFDPMQECCAPSTFVGMFCDP